MNCGPLVSSLHQPNHNHCPSIKAVRLICNYEATPTRHNKLFEAFVLFYKKHQIPTSDFVLLDKGTDVNNLDASWFPSFLKMRTSGYDGKGVQKLRSKHDATFNVSCVLEKCIDVKQEFAVLVSRHKDGTLASFPAVDMDFHAEANLVEFLYAPSILSDAQQAFALELAHKIARQLEIIGLLAIEFFL